MSAALSPRARRLRLLLLVGPGVLVILASAGLFAAALRSPEIDFGRQKLLAFTAAGLALAGAGALLHRKAVADLEKTGRAYGKTILFIALPVVFLPVFTLFVADQLVGFYLWQNPPETLLVFPAHNRVSYRTPEFSFTANTNAIGIRDREVGERKRGRHRILAIGDSFTYGWGVDEEQAWPKVLERLLGEKKRDAEVFNLGCPGGSVDAYALIAEKAIPLLKPDLVVIAVLQGDDLKQLDLGSTTDKLFQLNGVRSDDASRGLLANVFPNITTLASRMPRSISADDVREVWKANVRGIQAKLTAEERKRFDALDPAIKERFLAGEINPWDVNAALKCPDYMDFTLHPERDDVKKAADAMAANFAKIQEAAGQADVRVTAVSVPAGCYTCRKGLESRRKIGFRLGDEALQSDAPDEVIRSAATRTPEVAFYTFLKRFRAAGGDRDLYFDVDGHFNADGHALFAEEIADVLIKQEWGRGSAR